MKVVEIYFIFQTILVVLFSCSFNSSTSLCADTFHILNQSRTKAIDSENDDLFILPFRSNTKSMSKAHKTSEPIAKLELLGTYYREKLLNKDGYSINSIHLCRNNTYVHSVPFGNRGIEKSKRRRIMCLVNDEQDQSEIKGQWSHKANYIVFDRHRRVTSLKNGSKEIENYIDGMPHKQNKMTIIIWGQRKYLVFESRIVSFFRAIALDVEPRLTKDGYFYMLAEYPEVRPIGSPSIAKKYHSLYKFFFPEIESKNFVLQKTPTISSAYIEHRSRELHKNIIQGKFESKKYLLSLFLQDRLFGNNLSRAKLVYHDRGIEFAP